MALISIAKLLLFIVAVPSLLQSRQTALSGTGTANSLVPIWTLAALAVLAASLFWTSSPMNEALISLGKYGKL